VLIDYYVSATDGVGNTKQTDIYHVYIGPLTSSCWTICVAMKPEAPVTRTRGISSKVTAISLSSQRAWAL